MLLCGAGSRAEEDGQAAGQAAGEDVTGPLRRGTGMRESFRHPPCGRPADATAPFGGGQARRGGRKGRPCEDYSSYKNSNLNPGPSLMAGKKRGTPTNGRRYGSQ